MTDWRKAGQLADAHRIRNLLRSSYQSPDKARVRRAAVAYLASQDIELCADLWGGGTSADMLVSAGVAVLSIDDGRQMKTDHDISAARGRRALDICAAEGGYEPGWGSAAKHLERCDGAWLDLCGHWSPEMAKLLRGCRHMRAVALTVMPERTALGHLTQEQWVVALSALVEWASGMTIQRVIRYKRESGLPALVVLLKRTHGSCRWCERPVRRKGAKQCGRHECVRKSRNVRSEALRQRKNAQYLWAYHNDPDVRARMMARGQLPDVKEYKRSAIARRRSDPEYRAKANAKTREYRQRPEVRERDRMQRQTPEARAKNAARQRAYVARKRTSTLAVDVATS